MTRTEETGVSRISGGDLSILSDHIRGSRFRCGTAGGGIEIGNVFLKKNGAGFGRTDLSLRAIGTTFCALSSGHGPRGLGFQGGSFRVDFHVF